MSGIIVLDKPKDTSSAWYVYLLRPILGIKKIGHAGALDPSAEGVLIACIDRACKCTEMLMGLPKRYEATVQLGVTNACHDTEQPVEPYPDACLPSPQQVCEVLGRFRGQILQVPPVFSAVQVGGKRAYDLARAEGHVPIEPRPVTIYSLQVREYCWPTLKFEVVCGRGTYIRSLVRDLGEALACGAVCMELRRTAVGPFEVTQGVRLRNITREQVEERIIPVPRVREIAEAYCNGQTRGHRDAATRGNGRQGEEETRSNGRTED